MTIPSDPKEDALLLKSIIAGLAEQGLEGFEGTTPGTLCLKVKGLEVQFLQLRVKEYINFNELRSTSNPEVLILGSDSTKRSKTARKVLEVVRTLRYRHRIYSSHWPVARS